MSLDSTRKENPMNTRTSMLAAVLLVLTFGSTPARAQNAKPDDEGFIRDWLVLGPFALGEENAGAQHIDKTQLENEGLIKPKPGDKQKVGDVERAWKAITAKDYYFDLNELLGERHENVLGYLVTYVVADKDMPDVVLQMGSNDQGKIFLNGKEVVKFTETRAIDKDQDKADKVQLNKGLNVIVFKLINEVNDWQGCVRFTDKDGKPVKDLVVKTTP
jgi:hypothetical protein